MRQGPHFLRQLLPQTLATRTDVLSPRMVRIIGDIVEDWKYLGERIERVTNEIEGLEQFRGEAISLDHYSSPYPHRRRSILLGGSWTDRLIDRSRWFSP